MRDLNRVEVLDRLKKDQNSWALDFINVSKAHSKTKGEGVTIVTMDTGVDVNHKDISDRVISRFNMIEKSLDVSDELGHGTHVAGLLVGKRTGVAPMAKLHAIKVLDKDGNGSISNVMDGITHAINLKADVLSISLGVQHYIPQILIQRIIEAYEAGVTIVCAVGNDINSPSRYPASMNEVISVGGLDLDGNVADFSNYGYDVLAPSVEVLSTYKDGKYAIMNGTSMASPLVAGSIALLISYYRKKGIELSNDEIKEMIKGRLDLSKLIK